MKLITESPLINKKLIASNPIGKIAVIAVNYAKSPLQNRTSYKTFVVPNTPYETIINASNNTFKKDLMKALAKDNTRLTWTTSVQSWKNWASLRHAIITERNYLAGQHKNNGYFTVLVWGKPGEKNEFGPNSWYQVLDQQSNRKAKVLPISQWIDLSAITKKDNTDRYNRQVERIATEVRQASNPFMASRIVNTHRKSFKYLLYTKDYSYNPYGHNCKHTNSITGIGTEVISRLAMVLNTRSDRIYDANEKIRSYSTNKKITGTSVSNAVRKAQATLGLINQVARSPKMFYHYDFRTDQLRLASVSEIAKVVENTKESKNHHF